MYLKDESATSQVAIQIAQQLQKFRRVRQKEAVFTLYLTGELGAGKTSFARGFLRGLGYTGRVKSPTFTVVEPYQLNELMVYHLDLYRLADPEELEYLGLRDYLDTNAVLLIEWPERGFAELPDADIELKLQHCEDSQFEGRQLIIDAVSDAGQRVLKVV